MMIIFRLTKDPRFKKLKCDHQGTYADDCIVSRVKQDRVFIVGTCDKDLKRRIRKIPGVPVMYISNHKYAIERMPEAFGGNLIILLSKVLAPK
jgi:U3 small nucleolar RNA-associated protein 24